MDESAIIFAVFFIFTSFIGNSIEKTVLNHGIWKKNMIKDLGAFKVPDFVERHLAEMAIKYQDFIEKDAPDWVQSLLYTKSPVTNYPEFEQIFYPPYDHMFVTCMNDLFYKGRPTFTSMALVSAHAHVDDFSNQISTILVYVHSASRNHALFQGDSEAVSLKPGHIYSLNQKKRHGVSYKGDDHHFGRVDTPCVLLNVSFEKSR